MLIFFEVIPGVFLKKTGLYAHRIMCWQEEDSFVSTDFMTEGIATLPSLLSSWAK